MNETIINGIDVSECGYYNQDNEPFCCEIWDNECEAQDCYFKQSKRLKQQIEAYQLAENEAKEIIAELKHKNKRLQEENEKLKEVTNEAKIEYENLLINRNDFAERAEKYRQALEEIREITDEYITYCMGSKCEGMGEIQNKINEVLEDNEKDDN